MSRVFGGMARLEGLGWTAESAFWISFAGTGDMMVPVLKRERGPLTSLVLSDFLVLAEASGVSTDAGSSLMSSGCRDQW
ncbi:hypothetical protein Bca52824_027623 [Brassica carinata]|uniref:Uncharacterized protein n=1 Tax=Brassica carinata TaxID=52824 RepID=A0A8X7VAX7_BRACI|nr:hypothetical protein Bca52824_027623 [Brassica carinata]